MDPHYGEPLYLYPKSETHFIVYIESFPNLGNQMDPQYGEPLYLYPKSETII